MHAQKSHNIENTRRTALLLRALMGGGKNVENKSLDYGETF